MNIQRIESNHRMSQGVIHNGVVYLAGQVGAPGADIATQTKAVLDQIDSLLLEARSSRQRILTATIWLADMADFSAMNAVWDNWIGGVEPPARATGEAKLATPDYLVEIIITAAQTT